MTTNLQLAIERVYKTFATYPLRSKLDGCPCCVSERDQEAIHQKPLRLLTHDDLALYTFKAMTTWGDTFDFKHFLPRILELMTQAEFTTDASLVLGNDWHQWPVAEVNCITNFLMNWWTEGSTLNLYFDTSLVVDLYKTVGRIDLVLHHWPITVENYSFRNFIAFVTSKTAVLIHRKDITKT